MALSPLLPVRNASGEFFIADLFDNLPIKDDLASMEHPLFTLSTKPDRRTLNYENGDVKVQISPTTYGLPTIYDKDVLLYCASLLMGEINQGKTPPKTLRISVHDFFSATNRPSGGEAYKRFRASLDRLTSCYIKTTIKTGDITQNKGFGLIESYDFVESCRVKDRQVALQITLSEWFYNSLISREVLTIHKDYFRLRKSLDRRIYELARKHCGDQPSWRVSLAVLHHKSGSRDVLPKFRAAVRQLIKSQHLPDYTLALNSQDLVTIKYRKAKKSARCSEPLPEYMPAPLIEKAKVAGDNHDVYALWEAFKQWHQARRATPQNWQHAFLGFCREQVGAKASLNS